MSPSSCSWRASPRVRFGLDPPVRDKEYQGALSMQQAQLKAKDKELQALHTRLKQVRAQIDQQKAKRLNA